MQRLSQLSILSGLALMLAACAGSAEPPREDTGFAITVAPLTLPGVADACYGVSVYNEGKAAIGASALVWSKAGICASQFGDQRGSIAYVGTCDASPSGRTNTVALTLEGLCKQAGCDVADDVDPKTLASSTYQNPCPASAPCLLERACVDSADTAVEFNLTILRDASQGFFDVAVNFEDVFCSAKLDCVDELLHRPGPDGQRDLTAILAFACTSGSDDTCLYTNVITLDCGPGSVWTIDPSEGPGNIAVPAGSPLYGAATYSGDEGFTQFQKSYLNVALGLDETQFGALQNCTLRWTTTASESDWTTGAPPFATPAGHVYPFITWERQIIKNGALDCSSHPINVTNTGESAPSVSTSYTEIDSPQTFAFSNCDEGGCTTCPEGFTMNPDFDGCTKVTTEAPTHAATTYTVCQGDNITAYGWVGTIFTTSVVGSTFEVVDGSPADSQCTAHPGTCLREANLNEYYLKDVVGIWACGETSGGSRQPTGSWIGFSQCLDLTQGGAYMVGIAGDNHVRLNVDGVNLYQNSSDVNFRAWNVMPVQLTSGTHIIELLGKNDSGQAAFGAEIWGPFTAAEVATPAAMRDAYVAAFNEANTPKRVFTTADFRPATAGGTTDFEFDLSLEGTSAYSCPAGMALNMCGDPVCTKIETAACQ